MKETLKKTVIERKSKCSRAQQWQEIWITGERSPIWSFGVEMKLYKKVNLRNTIIIKYNNNYDCPFNRKTNNRTRKRG